MAAVLEVDRLSKSFCRDPRRAVLHTLRDVLNDVMLRNHDNQLRAGEFWALKDISFRVNPGEIVGIIGHNGAGKSTLLSAVTGILRPTVGRVNLNVNNVITMGSHADLNPVQTGRENIVNKLSLFGMPGRLIAENVEPVIEFAELQSAIDSPAGTYSLGMKMRLSFAIYTRLQPNLFIVDEGLNGGDLGFHRKFNNYIQGYIAAGGTILLASHNLPLVQQICQQCILIDHGEVIALGEPREVIDAYHALNDQRQQEMMALTPLPGGEFVLDHLGPNISNQDSDTVRIESAKVIAADGGEIAPGGAAIVEVVCHSDEAISRVSCTIELGSTEIFPLSILSNKCALEQGRNVFRCAIERLPLIPGSYAIAVHLIDNKKSLLLATKGYRDARSHFKIVSPPDFLHNVARHRKSPLCLSATWSKDN